MVMEGITMPETIPLFIEGFDSYIGGGVPEEHVILVGGAPGTMKTTIILNMMYNNALENGLKSLYISLEETKESIKKGMSSFGLSDYEEDDLTIIDFGEFRIQNPEMDEGHDWVGILLKYLEERIVKDGYDLVAIDSLSALYSVIEMKKPRQQLFHFFSALKRLKCTVMLITEMPKGSDKFGMYNEGFLADGIIYLSFHEGESIEDQLRIKCIKMRHLKHGHGQLRLIYSKKRFVGTSVISE